MAQKILMADDSATLRSMMKMPLVNAGYVIVEAEDGGDAFDKIKTMDKFDLLITDLNMPNMDGLQLCRAVRQLPDCKFMPIMMLTTEMGSGLKEQAKELGLTAWLTKPFNPEKLLTVVQKVLR